MNILTGGFNTYSSLDRRIFLLKYSSCKMLPAMYNSAESIVCVGWEAGGRGGAARPEQWRPRSVASVHCAAGCGLVEAGPCIGPGPDIVRPRYCAANGRGARPEPRTAPHRPAHYGRGSIVSGNGRQPPVHTTHSQPGLCRPYSLSCGDQAHLNPAPDPL